MAAASEMGAAVAEEAPEAFELVVMMAVPIEEEGEGEEGVGPILACKRLVNNQHFIGI
jgi:hypothetical protein